MFNQEQKDYMKSLSEIPPDNLCWCGWYTLGSCTKCPPNLSAKNKIDSWCEECHNEPSNYGKGDIRHRIGCSKKVK